MLVLSLFATCVFLYLRIWWLLAFVFLCFGLFTYGDIWPMLHVNIWETLQTHKWIVFAVSILISALLVALSQILKWNVPTSIRSAFSAAAIMLLWFSTLLLPWVVKNYYEIPQDIAVTPQRLLSWYGDIYRPDYSTLPTNEKRENKQVQKQNIVPQDEDLGRYFGYEEGIHNYMKLPFNATFQVNQKGAFTNISFIFFIFIPLVFIFMRLRHSLWYVPIIAFSALMFAYGWGYLPLSFLWNLSLPLWYIFVVWAWSAIFVYMYCMLSREEKEWKLFLSLLVFLTVYWVLWSVSALWIVWYWIVMYVVFIIVILFWLSSDIENNYSLAFSPFFLALCIVVFVTLTVLPNSVKAIERIGYPWYKLWIYTAEESLFKNFQSNLNTLFHLNLSEEGRDRVLEEFKWSLVDEMTKVEMKNEPISIVKSTDSIEVLYRLSEKLVEIPDISQSVVKAQRNLYKQIIYSPVELQNEKPIYKLWTFLRYYITQNKTRVIDDSLVMLFDEKIYDDDYTLVSNRLKYINIEYLLVDVNIPSIDKSKEKFLLKRFEKLISYLSHESVELIETDSICLEVAYHEFQKNQNLDEYLFMSWISYGATNKKKIACINKIHELITAETLSEDYDFLLPYKEVLWNALSKQKLTKKEQMELIAKYVRLWQMALFRIK